MICSFTERNRNAQWFLKPIPVVRNAILHEIAEQVLPVVPAHPHLQELVLARVKRLLAPRDEIKHTLLLDF